MDKRSYDVELTRADYAAGLAALTAELGWMDKSRPRLLFARLAMVTVMIAAVIYVFPEGVMALFAAAVLIWVGDLALVAAFQTQTLGISFDPAAHARTRVEFGDDGISEQGGLRIRRWQWHALRRVHLRAGHVVIELAGWDMIVLPDRLWADPAERGAFVAELSARPLAETGGSPLSPREAEARMMVVEPVLLARIAVTVAAFQAIFEPLVSFARVDGRSFVLLALAAGLLGAVLAWLASGRAFGWLVARSPSWAMRTSWTLLSLLAALFVVWFAGAL